MTVKYIIIGFAIALGVFLAGFAISFVGRVV